MSTKSFTFSWVKIFKKSSIFGIYNIMLIIGKIFYQIKVIAMMKNYDISVEINNNLNWHYTPDQPYRILSIGFLGSGKTNVLLNLY